MSTAIRRASDSRGGGIRGSCCMNAGRRGDEDAIMCLRINVGGQSLK